MRMIAQGNKPTSVPGTKSIPVPIPQPTPAAPASAPTKPSTGK